jgi:hypothetical protein
VRKDCTCDSSCFFIWVAGVKRYGNVLGLHRPYFNKEYFKDSTASEAEAKYNEGSNIVKKYLYNMDIPTNIVDEMFKHSSREIYYLDQKTVDSLSNVPFFEEWIIAHCKPLVTQEENDLKNLRAEDALTELTKEKKFYFEYLKDKKLKHAICMMNKIREVQLNKK